MITTRYFNCPGYVHLSAPPRASITNGTHDKAPAASDSAEGLDQLLTSRIGDACIELRTGPISHGFTDDEAGRFHLNGVDRWRPCSFNVSIEYSRSNLRRSSDRIRLKDSVTTRGRDGGFDRLPCVDVWRTFLLETKCREIRVDATACTFTFTSLTFFPPWSTGTPGTRHRDTLARRVREQDRTT